MAIMLTTGFSLSSLSEDNGSFRLLPVKIIDLNGLPLRAYTKPDGSVEKYEFPRGVFYNEEEVIKMKESMPFDLVKIDETKSYNPDVLLNHNNYNPQLGISDRVTARMGRWHYWAGKLARDYSDQKVKESGSLNEELLESYKNDLKSIIDVVDSQVIKQAILHRVYIGISYTSISDETANEVLNMIQSLGFEPEFQNLVENPKCSALQNIYNLPAICYEILEEGQDFNEYSLKEFLSEKMNVLDIDLSRLSCTETAISENTFANERLNNSSLYKPISLENIAPVYGTYNQEEIKLNTFRYSIQEKFAYEAQERTKDNTFDLLNKIVNLTPEDNEYTNTRFCAEYDYTKMNRAILSFFKSKATTPVGSRSNILGLEFNVKAGSRDSGPYMDLNIQVVSNYGCSHRSLKEVFLKSVEKQISIYQKYFQNKKINNFVQSAADACDDGKHVEFLVNGFARDLNRESLIQWIEN